MKLRAIRTVTLVSLAMVVTACANDQQRTCTEGAMAGAAGGGLIGQAANGNTKATLVGALIGGMAGAAFGCHVADQKAALAQREAELRASAERATAMANASRAEGERLTRQVAVLDQAVQNLRNSQMDARARQAAASAQQRQLLTLQASVDQRLQAVRGEIARQTALAQAAEAEAKRLASLPADGPAPARSEGLRLVSVGIRELDQQSRALELVKLQLQQIDRRRAY